MTARDERAGPARFVRGALAAMASTAVALLSHVAGGGQVPGMLGIVVPLALSLPACTALAGRRLSVPRLSVSVVVSQLFFHTLFVLGTPSGAAPASGGPHGHGLHAPVTLPAAQAPAHAMHTDPTMWAWHGVAAVITVVLLHRGETMLARLRELGRRAAAWLVRRWQVADRVPTFVVPRLPGVRAADFRPPPPGPQLAPLWRRGPPAPHAV
ncbi:hypothetical protein [Isoptericola sp. BMS4]|uniref:hypothetical protein n=1 Tax=Isoptericola sp. BMS4 TaxID=2527875 RepID=UPI0014238A86|nr:hypothetical protein [Isoptericola sp. BMS4]